MPMADNNTGMGSKQAQASKPSAERGNRPTGVTILAVLQILAGIAYIAVGLVEGAFVGVLSVLFVPLGLFALITGLALFTGRNWARILAMIGGALDLLDIPVGTIIGIVILWYFTRPEVKEYFGK